MPSLVWFRDDLRLADNAALCAAARRGPVVGLFVWDEVSPQIRPYGGASRWWLHHSLTALERDLAARGVRLIVRAGAARDVVPTVAREVGADYVAWNRRYGAARAIDADLKTHLPTQGVEVESFPGHVLFEPWEIVNGAGEPYRVYTPFSKACIAAREVPDPLPVPSLTGSALAHVPSLTVSDLALLPTQPDWAREFHDRWRPGEAGAHANLDGFIHERVATYAKMRNTPSIDATSLLSPHLRFGEISPRHVWHAVNAWRYNRSPVADAQERSSAMKFLKEVLWRECAWHTLYRHPDLASRNLDRRFDHLPWNTPKERELTAWKRGETGFAIVDAGMRELWRTGYMHNRVRMVCASLLTKNLLVDWRIGEQWMWDTLVDADEASNPFNWQWVAGSGLDAAPYFRIFNPQTQAAKFDPEHAYINTWAPHWMMHPPLVDLKESRARALDAYAAIKDLPRH